MKIRETTNHTEQCSGCGAYVSEYHDGYDEDDSEVLCLECYDDEAAADHDDEPCDLDDPDMDDDDEEV